MPKVCKSAKNETKLLLAYLGHGFVFSNKKLGSLARILGEMFLRLVYSCRHFCVGTLTFFFRCSVDHKTEHQREDRKQYYNAADYSHASGVIESFHEKPIYKKKSTHVNDGITNGFRH